MPGALVGNPSLSVLKNPMTSPRLREQQVFYFRKSKHVRNFHSTHVLASVAVYIGWKTMFSATVTTSASSPLSL